MEAFSYRDLFEPGAPHRVLARVSVRLPAEGGRDIPFGLQFRPNHNFGGEENRAFYIGNVEVPPEGLHPGESRELYVTFLNGGGLGDLLQIGRRWRIQEGPRWVANAEVLALHNDV
jgi:hypothetical protein